MHVSYEPEDTDFWIAFYKNLITEQQQRPDQLPLQRGLGAGLPGFHAYKGYQRGAGLGNFFASLFRRALPFLKTAAKAVGKQALSTGAHVAADVIDGREFKESIAAHGKDGLKNVLKNVGDAFSNETTQQQQGEGLGRAPKRKKTTTMIVSRGGKRSRRAVDSEKKAVTVSFLNRQHHQK
jgi:hypothetical protein